MAIKFTHLHVHSHYSLLDGLSKIDDIVNRCKETGMDSIALTDHGNLYGAIEFYQKARRAGIKPIIGCELYVAAGRMRDKNPGVDDKRFHLTVLAENETGYKNLIQLVSKAHLEGFYYKPRVDKELLQKHARGLIALSGCQAGEISRALSLKKLDAAERIARAYQDIFGTNNFYLEIQKHPNLEGHEIINQGLRALSQKTACPLAATTDSHYITAQDAEAQDILVSVQTGGGRLGDEDRFTMRGANLSLRAPREMEEMFSDLPEALARTQEIADRVSLELVLGKNVLPHFTVPPGYDADSYLQELALRGLEKRYGISGQQPTTPSQQPIIKRLDYELSVIHETGFASYFLIVQDLVNWAKEHGIVVGPGRGSAAGSLVSYALGITNIDPLRYNLLFERFLNPERISMPDIDLDFADTRRDEVLEYVAKKYGRDRVAQIITFGTMAARAAIRDAGRAIGMPYSFCDQIAKMIPFSPQGEKTGWLKKSLQAVQEFKEIYARDPEAKRLIDAAIKLEGVARHASTHACGVVIAPRPLMEYVPLQHATKRTERNQGDQKKEERSASDKAVVTQYEMHAVEDLGLLKMDLLGLRNLTIIENTIQLARRIHGIEIDIEKIPLGDHAVYELFQRGETTGLFQFESPGMRRYLKELKPTELEDLIAMVALYRPGPMELIPSYIRRKHGQENISYIHPKLEPILRNTHGIGVYQEQMMQIARDLGGYTLPEADTLRKAIGKKVKSLLHEQRQKLTSGMIRNGLHEKIAEQIWQLFPPFARYGFNRCVTGDTKIPDPITGNLFTVRDIYAKKQSLRQALSLNADWKLKVQPVTNVFFNGRKRVYELTTRSGRRIKATANHPFLTPGGWKPLSAINRGEKIATPRRIPEPREPRATPPSKLGLLGYLLAEGNLCHPSGFYFYSNSEEEVSDYLTFLENFDNTAGTIDKSKSAIAVYARRKDLKHPSKAVEWIASLGLKYKKATEKFFPDFVFQLPNSDLALLIGKMFQGDGCINLKRDPQIFYATSSQTIAAGLQHLLLRFNILSSVHEKRFKYRGGLKTGYTVTISRYDNIQKFAETFGKWFVGAKSETIGRIMATHPILNGSIRPWSARGSYDIIPAALGRDLMRKGIRARQISFASAAREAGLSERLFGTDSRKIGYLRETLDVVARAFNDESLHALAQSDVYWDEIKTIRAAGRKETYDLAIDTTHNFVANDIIVHNSHAACYALIAYQTGWLKAHYPTEFMTALLAAESTDIEKTAFFVEETRAMDIEILPPDVNESFASFTAVAPKKIRFGLGAVKHVGSNIVDALIEERERAGKFETITNFAERVRHKDFNKKSLEALAKCGALDAFGERGRLLANVEMLLEYNRESQRVQEAGQGGLFDTKPDVSLVSFALKTADPAPKRECLQWEKELLGLYVTEHPLEEYRNELERRGVTSIKNLSSPNFRNQRIAIAGMVNAIQKITTKSGQPMLFVKMEDLSGRTEVLVFPKTLAQNPGVWQTEKVLVVRGRVSDKDGVPKILCEDAVEIV